VYPRLRKVGVLNPQEGVEPADVGRKVTSHTPNPEYDEGGVKSTNWERRHPKSKVLIHWVGSQQVIEYRDYGAKIASNDDD
jgi:hypothetical protein